MKMLNKVLVKYKQDLYYGVLEGLFITTKDDLDKLKHDDVDFGECLGKHSEVILNNTFDYCEVISYDQDLISDLETVFYSTNISGYNPLDYLPDYDEDGGRV